MQQKKSESSAIYCWLRKSKKKKLDPHHATKKKVNPQQLPSPCNKKKVNPQQFIADWENQKKKLDPHHATKKKVKPQQFIADWENQKTSEYGSLAFYC